MLRRVVPVNGTALTKELWIQVVFVLIKEIWIWVGREWLYCLRPHPTILEKESFSPTIGRSRQKILILLLLLHIIIIIIIIICFFIFFFFFFFFFFNDWLRCQATSKDFKAYKWPQQSKRGGVVPLNKTTNLKKNPAALPPAIAIFIAMQVNTCDWHHNVYHYKNPYNKHTHVSTWAGRQPQTRSKCVD